ncbi:hypothetical protein [Mycolicibacterium sphagni]|uniref:Uncharacterized protein n=1 Tax=Mycolicibacterium sphagni TaxID=1786 RepID=A0ABX2JSB8_9MYCO|nr:hypothetical protein [Mycolicibacterium sphagni]NTY58724.1 hypothetical protein [Mycolicibacterium sphagni]
MTQRYVFPGYTIGAAATMEVGKVCTSGTYDQPLSNQGPAVFQAIPNTMAYRPVYVAETGITCWNVGGIFGSGIAYYCKIRNENPSPVGFDLHMVTFGDEPIGELTWETARDLNATPLAEVFANVKFGVLWGPHGVAATALQAPDAAPAFVPGPGQSFHVVDVTEDLAKIRDVEELHAKLQTLLKKDK